MKITYQLTAQVIEPSGTELADDVLTVLSAEGSQEVLTSVFEHLQQTSGLRLRLSRVETEAKWHQVKFRRSSADNPFVT